MSLMKSSNPLLHPQNTLFNLWAIRVPFFVELISHCDTQEQQKTSRQGTFLWNLPSGETRLWFTSQAVSLGGSQEHLRCQPEVTRNQGHKNTRNIFFVMKMKLKISWAFQKLPVSLLPKRIPGTNKSSSSPAGSAFLTLENSFHFFLSTSLRASLHGHSGGQSWNSSQTAWEKNYSV